MVKQAVDQSRRDAQHPDLRTAQRAQGVDQPFSSASAVRASMSNSQLAAISTE
jgi:hypothetical protein